MAMVSAFSYYSGDTDRQSEVKDKQDSLEEHQDEDRLGTLDDALEARLTDIR